MSSATRHLLSRPVWETTFDEKENAFELQQRLSAWSRNIMPKEVAAVFDALCPPQQTWRIPSLTVDLGTIDFSNLEAELSIKLRKQLLEELTNLAISNESANGSLMTIADERSLQLETLRYFLTSGILPWNCPVGTSYHEILTDQLQNNHTGLIAMIRETGGGTNRAVRRRIAWQTPEPTLKKVIAALEPANHQEVTAFSSELNKLQATQHIVAANTGQLQREVWLWILDYLLVERGTLFNQKEMMKSSIRQMAAHYNLGYGELLVLISAAAKKISARQGTRSGFITVLNELEDERPVAVTDHWAQLNQYFSSPGTHSTTAYNPEFNELVNRLSQKDRDRFTLQVNNITRPANGWHPAMDALGNAALSCMFFAAAGNNQPAGLRAIMELLSTLAGRQGKEVWRAGFTLLKRNPANVPAPAFFPDNLLTDLRKSNQMAPMLRFEVATAQKTPANLEIYQNLYKQAEPKFTKKLLDDLYRLLKSPVINHNRLMVVQEQLEVIIAATPKDFIAILSDYHRSGRLKNLLPYLMSPVLSQAAYTAFPVLAELGVALTRWRAHPVYGEIARHSLENLPESGLLQALSGNAGLTEHTLTEVFYRLSAGLGDKADDFKRLLLNKTAERQQSTFKRAMALVKLGDVADRQQVAQILRSAFHDREFAALRSIDHTEAGKLLNYLLPGNWQITRMAADFDIFWKSILDSISHQGDLQQLTSDYQKAARQHLAQPAWITGQLQPLLKKNPGGIPQAGALKKVLEFRPSMLRALLADEPANGKIEVQIRRLVSFDLFATSITADTGGPLAEAIRNYRSLYLLAEQLCGNDGLPQFLQDLYWKEVLEAIRLRAYSASGFKKLVKITLTHLIHKQGLNTAEILRSVKTERIHLTPALINALSGYHPELQLLRGSGSEILTATATANLLYTLSLQLIMNKGIPDWYAKQHTGNMRELLIALLSEYPQQFFTVIKNETITEPAWQWLHKSVSFSAFALAIGSLQPNKQSLLAMITGLYKALGQFAVNGLTAADAQYILFKKVIKAWRTGNWTALSAGNILNELVWDLGLKKGVKPIALRQELIRIKFQLPPALQNSLVDRPAKPRPLPTMRLTENKLGEGTLVHNAGLVLLNTYIPLLFDRLGLAAEGRFRDTSAREDAVHYLQYLATGLNGTEESLLPLNKLLCGLNLSHPVPYELPMEDDDAKLMDGLIEAAINHWGAIGDSSISGFRGNWLVRDGLLTEHAEKWELTVEKRAYDILLYQSPYSFTIINYPWMNKPLYVSWPY
jgi:hypothetical protein